MPMTIAVLQPAPNPESRPGLTSLIKTGRGVMTIQTEILGDPARLITIVDFRGRVLKTWQSDDLIDASDLVSARKWHQAIERDVRGSLSKATQRGSDRSASVGGCLFVEAMRAYATRDYGRAKKALMACAHLLPSDPRVHAAMARLQSLES
jgi:hypothetical protein